MDKTKPLAPWREKIHEVTFGAETPMGKAFDIILLVLILASVLVVMLESVHELQMNYGDIFFGLEWFFTIFFTIEYILRILAVRKPLKYMLSFFGIIDLLAIIPTYLSLFIAGTHYLLVIRALRLLRVFRIFKLAQFLKESDIIVTALKASRAKITVFLVFVVLMVTIVGSIMYFVEGGDDSNFTSIPRSIYWSIVTLTTVGYGDIAPVTSLGQFLASIVMILGYGVIAVPTGIVTSEFAVAAIANKTYTNKACKACSEEGHEDDAICCKYCGEEL